MHSVVATRLWADTYNFEVNLRVWHEVLIMRPLLKENGLKVNFYNICPTSKLKTFWGRSASFSV